MEFPADLQYTSHDEWIRKEGDLLVLGITAHAQDAMGDIVFVDLPEVGDTFEAGAAIAEIESSKAVAEIFTPVACEIAAVNEDLDGEEEKVNESPYGDGWLVKLRPTGDADLSALMDAAAYQGQLDS